jgi:hypothetical protein
MEKMFPPSKAPTTYRRTASDDTAGTSAVTTIGEARGRASVGLVAYACRTSRSERVVDDQP